MLHTPTCILNLYHDSSKGCQLALQWVPPKILLFFPKMTRIMVSCSGTMEEKEMVSLVSIHDTLFWQIKTESWTLQTSGSYHLNLVHNENACLISRTAIQDAIAKSSSLWLPLNDCDEIVFPHFNSTHWDTLPTWSPGTEPLQIYSVTLSSLELLSVIALSLACLWRAAVPFTGTVAAPHPQEHKMAQLN